MTTIQRITARERVYVQEVLDAQFHTSAGSMMSTRLERQFAEKFQSKYAISFINGTATMHAALVAAGVGPGNEVIVPPLTMASTSFAVLHAGAVPVFADIDPQTWLLDPKAVERQVTARTKAIIPVSLYGLSPDMDALMTIAERHKLFVLEDDAECFLGYYKGRIVGSIGHASSFSFQSSKHMTSGEGGMITTNDEQLANEIRRFSSLGYAAVGAKAGKITKDTIQDPTYERHASIGFNYRIPELCAAVALGQLEHLEELVTIRTHAAQCFAQAVAGCRWLVPQAVPDGYVHSYWTYVLKLENGNAFTWTDFRNKYLENGGDRFYGAWQLTYLEPAFRGQVFGPEQPQQLNRGLCPVAEAVQPCLIQLKTNYFDNAIAEQKAEALHRTIQFFEQ
ncbi:MAG: DegT/DnrJ/EryC1/StrS family aminotransferase [Caldilineaceae bacterium]